MRLCVISHSYVERGYLPVVEMLASQPGVELGLITPAEYRLGLHTSSGSLEAKDVSFKLFPVPIRLGGRQGTFLYERAGLAAALDAFRPDVILHEQEVFALGAAQVAYMTNKLSIPLAMFVWENVYRKLSLPRQWLKGYVLGRCAGVMAGSGQAAAVHRSWGFRGPIAVIPQMGAALNLNPAFGRRGVGSLKVCFAGRLIESKGVDTLIRAIAVLQGRGLTVTCRVAGKGPSQQELSDLSQQLGTEAAIEFKGAVPMPEVAEILKGSDVLVLPSRRTPTWEEQYGRILVEAMVQGTIAVGSRTGAIPEVIGSEDLLFEEDDVNGLAAVLERLARDDVFFLKQQQRLWTRARNEYTTEVLSEKKVEFLRSLVGKGSGS